MTPEIAYSGINKARARDFYIAAEIKFNQKNWPDARQALVECLKHDPNHREAIELAALYLKSTSRSRPKRSWIITPKYWSTPQKNISYFGQKPIFRWAI